jgi:hypothetical protein
VEWIHTEAPGIRMGYFGIIPQPAYSWSLKSESSRQFQDWQVNNEALKPIATMVDVIFPCIYTYYNNPDEWRKFAIQTIREAKRYGKMVYCFIWPQYSEKNKILKHSYIDSDFWSLQLRTVYEHADGIVIWGGWDGDTNKPLVWDNEAAWYKETKYFLENIRSK